MSSRLGIIGGGNMGGAIVRGCISAAVLKPQEMIVAEFDEPKRRTFAQLGCATTDDPATAAAADQIILAIKPQSFAEVARAIAPLAESRIVISIMAGPNSAAMRAALGGRVRIVRAMPNVACQIGASMTAIALGDGAQPGDESLALAIFGALGRTTIVDESLIPAATAVSASGPAYIFALAEAMEQAAIELGFDQATARLLVQQTVFGAGRLLNESDQGAAALRQSVTSPAGTTAAALEIMHKRNFTQIVIEALKAARDRGIQLDATQSDQKSRRQNK